MLNPTSSSAIFGRTATSLPKTATVPGEESTLSQGTTNKERAMRRFEDELKKLKGQGNHSNNEPAASSSMNPSQKLSRSSDRLGENEQYAKALLIAVREEIYKKGYKSSNKRRATPPTEDKNQWKEAENERCSKAGDEVYRIRKQLPSGAAVPYFLKIQKAIQHSIDAEGHNCHDLSHAGIGILDDAGIKDTHIVNFRDFDHGMILIGRIPPSGLPLEMEKWPSHLAICDPWANIACPAKAFIPAFMKKMQKWEDKGKEIRDPAKKAWTTPTSLDLEKKLRGRRDVYAPLDSKELKDKDGRTPLITTVYTGKVDDVKLLLKAGADIEAKDNKGLTPLLVAFYTGNVKMLSTLIEAGANIEATGHDGSTPLMMAAYHAHLEALGILLKAGANINAKNNYGCTALEYAAIYADAKTLDLLIKADADLNPKNINGVTPLMSSIYKGNTETLGVLIKAGADIEAKDNEGYTALLRALEMAVSNNDSYSKTGLQMLKTLLAASADITVQNKEGKTAKEYATELAIARDDKELLALIEAAWQKQKMRTQKAHDSPGHA